MSEITNEITGTTSATPGASPTPHNPVAPAPKKAAKGEVTPEYIEMLRNENKERRAETELLNKKLSENEEATKKALDEVKSLNQQAEQKMIRADLKVFANKFGLRDLEDVKLADLSAIKIDSNGDVHGVEEAMQTLKEKKPYLFAEVSTGRADFNMQPAGQPTHQAKAAEVAKMTESEFKEYKQKWLSELS